MSGIILTKAVMVDSSGDRRLGHIYDLDKCHYIADGRIFVRKEDIVRVSENKGNNICVIEVTNNHSNLVSPNISVMDTFDSIMSQMCKRW